MDHRESAFRRSKRNTPVQIFRTDFLEKYPDDPLKIVSTFS